MSRLLTGSQVSAQGRLSDFCGCKESYATSGTMQIAFRGEEQSTQRYVVAINSREV